jgi:hypothetical protein
MYCMVLKKYSSLFCQCTKMNKVQNDEVSDTTDES